ncbi:transposase [Methyloglobulus sp.]|uniref:transposase n=1 Tax=Methyloglobulus sp. TaxID=2518622 RepID=UPI0018494C9B|nr:transposase [Methyloglobulus sp.]
MIDWKPIDQQIRRHYATASDVVDRPAYPSLLLFKMLLVGLWHGGLSDEAVEDIANVNLHVSRFPGLPLEDEVPDHSVLSRFRTQLTKAHAWDGLLAEINRQIEARVDGLKTAIQDYLDHRNSKRKPYHWTAKPETILAKPNMLRTLH